MKKLCILALLVTALAACNNAPQQQNHKPAHAGKHAGPTYTCTMHPDVKADKPGVCPKCGMDLVEKDEQ